MSERKDAARRGRLKKAMTYFLGQQVWLSGPNKGRPCVDPEVQVDMASQVLGAGWSETTVKTAAGSKQVRTQDWFPQGSSIVRLCEVSGVSADWIFFGTGPMLRQTSAAGGILTDERLETEVAAFVTASLGKSEYLKRFNATVSGRACLDRLLAIAKSEEQAEAGLLAVSDTAIEAVQRLVLKTFAKVIAAMPAITALNAIVLERATLADAPLPVYGPRLLRETGEGSDSNQRTKPSRQAALALESLTVTRRAGQTTRDFMLRGDLTGSPRAHALVEIGRSRARTR